MAEWKPRAEDTTRFVEAAEAVKEALNTFVLIPHHANKSSWKGAEQDQTAARGSSALPDGGRWQMNLAGMTFEEAKRFGCSERNRRLYISATVTKTSYVAPSEPGISLTARTAATLCSRMRLMPLADREANILIEAIVAVVKKHPGKFTRNAIETSSAPGLRSIGASQGKKRTAVDVAVSQGLLTRDGKGRLTVESPVGEVR